MPATVPWSSAQYRGADGPRVSLMGDTITFSEDQAIVNAATVGVYRLVQASPNGSSAPRRG